MGDVEEHPDRADNLRHRVSELISRHRDSAAGRHEERELAEDEADAGFDLGTDLAQPGAPTGSVDFDLAKDIGIGNGSPEPGA